MTDPEHPEPDGNGVSPRLIGGILLGVALTAFVVQNTDDTEVTWLFFDATQPLWIVLLVTAAVTVVAVELITGARRRRRRKRG